VELGPIATRFDISAPAYFARELAELTGMPDLAHYDASANAIRTTPMGKLLVRNVCMLFDRYARPVTAEAPRFSSTI